MIIFFFKEMQFLHVLETFAPVVHLIISMDITNDPDKLIVLHSILEEVYLNIDDFELDVKNEWQGKHINTVPIKGTESW